VENNAGNKGKIARANRKNTGFTLSEMCNFFKTNHGM